LHQKEETTTELAVWLVSRMSGGSTVHPIPPFVLLPPRKETDAFAARTCDVSWHATGATAPREFLPRRRIFAVFLCRGPRRGTRDVAPYLKTPIPCRSRPDPTRTIYLLDNELSHNRSQDPRQNCNQAVIRPRNSKTSASGKRVVTKQSRGLRSNDPPQ
jgi:hypothetical protein